MVYYVKLIHNWFNLAHRDDVYVAALAIAVFLQFKVPHLKNVSTEGQEADENRYDIQYDNQDDQDDKQDDNQDIESNDDDEAQIKSILFIVLLQKVGLVSREKI